MINVRLPILLSLIFFFVFISSPLLFATPCFASRVGNTLVHQEVTTLEIPEEPLPEEPEIPEEQEVPEEPEIPKEPEVSEEPEKPEEPEVPEEPEIPKEPEIPEEPEKPEKPEEPEGPNFGLPSWIPSFPFPGINGGVAETEKEKPTSTVKEVSSSNKKP